METLLQWLSLYADSAHYIIFALLILAGFSLPVSEEVMLIVSGVLASNVVPERTVHLFISSFLGCYFSDWIAYWLGRGIGDRLYRVKWLPFAVTEKRIARLQWFYANYGFWTLFIGRFIPFGVRNGIFMTAGVGKMHFGKFACSDLVGCLFFSVLIFYLAYSFGKNYDALCHCVHQSNIIIFALFAIVVVGVGLYFWFRKRPVATDTPSIQP